MLKLLISLSTHMNNNDDKGIGNYGDNDSKKINNNISNNNIIYNNNSNSNNNNNIITDKNIYNDINNNNYLTLTPFFSEGSSWHLNVVVSA